MATSVPSWPSPGNPPKFNTRKAQIVVIAAQEWLGAMAPESPARQVRMRQRS